MAELVARTAAALMIGNELLSGKVADANLVELARTLRTLGVELTRAVVIPDEVELICSEIKALSQVSDVVFTSGGVGPTHDDVTLDAVARAFGAATRVDAGLRQLLEKAYGEGLTEAHLRMARVPIGADLKVTPEIPWPTVVMHNVWMLPGVPEIFRMKLAVVRAWVRGPDPFLSRSVFTQLEEASIKPILDHVVHAHPSVQIGSYPKWFDATYKTKVTFDARDDALIDRAVDEFLSLLPEGEPQRVE